MAEALLTMTTEERKCVNCVIYDWKQPCDKSDIKRCSGCQVFWYCSDLCQKEHWRNIHKNQCKYMAGREVLANASHDEANCLVCKEESKAGKMTKTSNPVLPCTMSTTNHNLMNKTVPIGMPAIPLAEMTGNYHSKQDHTVALMMRILVKMRMTKHIIWRVEKNIAEDLYGLLGNCRVLVWQSFVCTHPRPLNMVCHGSLVELVNQISEVVDKLENLLRDADESAGQSVFKPWGTFKVLIAFLIDSFLSPSRFIADCIGVAELPAEIQRIRMTHAHYNQVCEKVLDMLSVGLVPYTRLVEALCDGNLVQPCYVCGDQVTVVDAAALEYCRSNDLNLVPTLCVGGGIVYSLCGEQRCLDDHSKSNSFRQGYDRLCSLYTRLSYEYWGQSCNYCGGFNQEVKGYRCAGCKTKVYCGYECHVKDKEHLKLCKSVKGEERERKEMRGKARRMETVREEYEKKFGELAI